ncbi:hypothetical protein [Rufibacter ruber]|uniref:hypothetical protein n=1 Tax=Rufibacter ruber TaxID=1783499 RepID=UPI000A4BA201|nr:hypothetical protein [Rufibacter ruber]
MGIKDIVNKVKEEVKVLQGEASKDKLFTNEQAYADEATAQREFLRGNRNCLT